MIDPEEVMARYSVEEICAGAEHYFSSIEDPGFHEKKPFSSVEDAAELLQEVGLLLRGLRLGPGMRVLDLGAGTAWLSRLLNELGCRVTACDPSKTALEIGQRNNRRFPFVDDSRLEYQVFNGTEIEQGDATFDRVICFESFHHMPNWEEVLEEIHRVLKPGGVVGFAEPGYRHSRSAMSQYEMEHFVVLENDIRLDRIVPVAERLGFEFRGWEGLIQSRLDLATYRTTVQGRWWSLRRYRLGLGLLRALRRKLGGRTVFFLGKGSLRLDSRTREGLAAAIRPNGGELRYRAGSPTELKVRLTNCGDAAWLHPAEAAVGGVHLGAHLIPVRGETPRRDLCRVSLSRTLEAGETDEVLLTVPSLPDPEVMLELDLVAEGVTWFAQAEDLRHETVKVKLGSA